MGIRFLILLSVYSICSQTDGLLSSAYSNNEDAARLRLTRSTTTKCTVNGKVYNEGETWASNHLRFKCAKFGSRHVLGCIAGDGKELNANETYIEDNVAHQCIKKGSRTQYREMVCGIVGQPDCDKLTYDDTIVLQQTLKMSTRGNLPIGWKRINSNTMIATRGSRSVKFERGAGVGSAIPINLALNGTKMNERIAGVGDGSVSLDSRTKTVSDEAARLKNGTTSGQRSDVKWSGKTQKFNNRRIAVGPGTFTFGVSPTGSILTKSNRK